MSVAKNSIVIRRRAVTWHVNVCSAGPPRFRLTLYLDRLNRGHLSQTLRNGFRILETQQSSKFKLSVGFYE